MPALATEAHRPCHLLRTSRVPALLGALVMAVSRAAFAGPGDSQQPIASAISGKLHVLVDSCFGADTFKESFFPAAISDYPTANQTSYKHISGASFPALASYTYVRSDLSEALSGSPADFISFSTTPVEIGGNAEFNMLTYSFSCTSALKTAVDAGFDTSPWFHAISIKAGLSAEASNSQNTGLLVLYGRFQSPLSAMLNDKFDNKRRIQGYSAVWLHSSPATNGKRSYLDYLDGWLLSSTSARNAARALAINASADAHALVLDAKWTGAAKVNYTSDFSSQVFDVYVVKVGSSYAWKFYEMPGPARISTEIARAASINPQFAEVAPGQTARFSVSIPGLPANLCTASNAWTASVPAPDSAGVVTASHDSAQELCTLMLDVNVNANNTIKDLPMTLTEINHKIDGTSVKFDVLAHYRAASLPLLHLTDIPSTEVTLGGDSPRLSISAPFEIDAASGSPISNIHITGGSLSCAGAPAVAPAMVYEYVRTPTQSVRTRFSFPDRATFPSAKCTWVAYVDFMHGTTIISQRPLSSELTLSASMVPAKP